VSVYEASPVKHRRTRAALADVDDAIYAAVELEHPITLRGVFYRVVSMGAVEKTDNGYELIGRQLLKLRRGGTIPYDWIIDGVRWINKPDSYDSLDQMLEDAAASYRRDLWRNQAVDVHLYSEKDAISSVILPVTRRWDVPLGIVRGYSSESFAWSAAEAIKASRKRTVYVYQLGDHDPSGIDAWRAFRDRIVSFLGKTVTPQMVQTAREFGLGRDIERWLHKPLGVHETEPDEDYCQHEDYCTCWDNQVSYLWVHADDHASRKVTFARLAVTEDQIRDLNLPTRPTKRTDARARGFDGGSVEVDAIPPTVLRQIVESAVTRHIDPEARRITEIAEQSEREILTSMIGGTE
jgi:hypothetical protein